MSKPVKPEDAVLALHEGIARVLQSMYDEYGIQVLSAKVYWADISEVATSKHTLSKLILETQTHPTTKK